MRTLVSVPRYVSFCQKIGISSQSFSSRFRCATDHTTGNTRPPGHISMASTFRWTLFLWCFRVVVMLASSRSWPCLPVRRRIVILYSCSASASRWTLLLCPALESLLWCLPLVALNLISRIVMSWILYGGVQGRVAVGGHCIYRLASDPCALFGLTIHPPWWQCIWLAYVLAEMPCRNGPKILEKGEKS